ncbi:MAG: PorT family protein [Flavobacteriales bacterium]|nr:PorT family protein [Flavobacteriales bacterium]MCB0786865.1 PorT family protein [Flavobacteriales bacterium]
MIHIRAKYFFAACFLLAACVLRGQAAILVLLLGDKVATENFHFSIDGGLNVATLPGLDGGEARLGLNFGLGTYIRLNDNWALTPEFKPLVARGANGLDKVLPDPAGVVDNADPSELRLNYIDVPLQVHRRINDRLYVRGGPQVSFLTAALVRTKGTLETGEGFTLDNDVKDELEPVDLSFPIDLGIVLRQSSQAKGVELRLRYTPGFMEVFKDTEFLSSTNSTFQFFLSLPFVSVEEPTTP